MARSLADGHEKLTILTVAPSNPAAPTAAELNAGIDISQQVLASDYTFGPAASETFSERAIGDTDNPQAFGVSNGQFQITLIREFPAADDDAFQAVKAKGSTIWAYARKTEKLSTATWASADEIRYGAEVLLDVPMDTSAGGYVKVRVMGLVQNGYPFIAVASS